MSGSEAESNVPPATPPAEATPVGQPARGVARLFPFVRRTRTLLVGRRGLLRSKRRLHFVLIPRDISPAGREAVLRDFAHYPVVQHFTTAELERWFDIRHVKVVGFAKSSLAQSIYAELKASRINKPVAPGATAAPTREPDRPPPPVKSRPPARRATRRGWRKSSPR